jgi:hypothetical protein
VLQGEHNHIQGEAYDAKSSQAGKENEGGWVVNRGQHVKQSGKFVHLGVPMGKSYYFAFWYTSSNGF